MWQKAFLSKSFSIEAIARQDVAAVIGDWNQLSESVIVIPGNDRSGGASKPDNIALCIGYCEEVSLCSAWNDNAWSLCKPAVVGWGLHRPVKSAAGLWKMWRYENRTVGNVRITHVLQNWLFLISCNKLYKRAKTEFFSDEKNFAAESVFFCKLSIQLF